MKLRLVVVLIVAGAVFTFLGGRGLLVNILPATDIYDQECDWTKLHKNQRVHVKLDFVIEPFEETTDEDNRSVSQIYTIPDLKSDEDGYVNMVHYMGIVVNPKDYAAYDKLVDDSWDWWDGEYDQLGERGYIEVDGYLRKMSSKEEGFLRDYLKDWNYSDSEIEEAVVPYVLMKNQTPIANIAMFGGGIIAFLAGILVAVLSLILKK